MQSNILKYLWNESDSSKGALMIKNENLKNFVDISKTRYIMLHFK